MSRSDPAFETLPPDKRVKTALDAARFIDRVGFCVLFPVKNVPLPSLYFAMGRRWPPKWDDDAKKLWRWKNELPKKRRAFYGKYFKGRGTFLSLESLSLLLSIHETAVAPDAHDSFYASGRISTDAQAIWQALAALGPLPTLELRHAVKMETQRGNPRFKKAVAELQSLLVVTHSGTEQETESWASNRFDLVSRTFPKQIAQAWRITQEDGRRDVAAKYRKLYPAAMPVQIARLFGWTKAQAVAAVSL